MMNVKCCFLLLASILFSGCQVTNLYDARPLKKGEKALSISLDSSFATDIGDPTVKLSNQLIPMTPIAPALEYSWGTNFRTHMTINLSMARGMSLGGNVGIVNNPGGKVAVSVYPRTGLSVYGGGLAWFSHLPLLISLYPTEKLSLTFSPGLLISKVISDRYDAEYYGYGSVNILHGRKNKLGLSIGVMPINGLPIAQCSIGYSIRFRAK